MRRRVIMVPNDEIPQKKENIGMYEKITLDNGVRIMTERVPGMRSAALGI